MPVVAYEIPYKSSDRVYYCIECGPEKKELYGDEVRTIESSQFRWPLHEKCEDCGSDIAVKARNTSTGGK